MKRFLSFLFVVFLAAGYACAQDPAAIPDDSFYEQTQRQRFPVFGMFKETYFVTGIPANTSSIDKHNADVRFQVSLALRVARIDNVDILGTYTETGVWHVYDTSSPLVENAFNPGLCVYWYVNPKLDMMFGLGHIQGIWQPSELYGPGKSFQQVQELQPGVQPFLQAQRQGNLPACRFRPVQERLLRNSAEFQQVRVSLQGRVLSGAQARLQLVNPLIFNIV